MYRIDPSAVHLAREFRANPWGRHSAELQRVLNAMRSEPLAGRWAVVNTRPHREWVLAQLSGVPGAPPRFYPDIVFGDLKAAEWHIFKQRWQQLTGQALDIE